MSFSNERKAIEGLMATFGAAYPTIPIAYEGLIFERPATSVSWIALFILGGTSGSKIELGPNVSTTFRRAGIIQVNIHVEEQNGSEAARVIGDNLNTFFNNVDILTATGIIRTETATLKSLGSRDGFYSMIYSLPYMRDSRGA